MSTTKIIYYVIICINLSCKIAHNNHNKFNADNTFKKSFSGWDRFGTFRTCQQNKVTTCPIINDNAQLFFKYCQQQQLRVFTCGCNDYLCEENITQVD